jgi:AcrR family transcriptional regulator
MDESSKKNDDTKARLIEAAGEVFAEYGFRSATVREICRRAGANVAAVNYHFRDKEGLYVAVLEHSLQSARRRYPPDLGLRDGATPEEKLRAFIRSLLLRILGEGVPAWHGKLMAREMSDPTEALEQVVKSSVRPLHMYLVSILSELLTDTEPTEAEESDAIFLCATSIIGQCMQHFTGRRIVAALRPKSFNPADIDQIADHITRFSLGGIQALRTQGSASTP